MFLNGWKTGTCKKADGDEIRKGGRDEITKGDTEPYEGVTRETE